MTGKTFCRDICRYAQFCYEKGFDDLEPENCAKYYKIEDLLWDAECDARDDREQQREMEMTEPDDWYDM